MSLMCMINVRGNSKTDRLCEDSGFALIPMVMKAHSGAWSPAARRILDDLAKGQAAAANADPAKHSLKIAQRLSISLLWKLSGQYCEG